MQPCHSISSKTKLLRCCYTCFIYIQCEAIINDINCRGGERSEECSPGNGDTSRQQHHGANLSYEGCQPLLSLLRCCSTLEGEFQGLRVKGGCSIQSNKNSYCSVKREESVEGLKWSNYLLKLFQGFHVSKAEWYEGLGSGLTLISSSQLTKVKMFQVYDISSCVSYTDRLYLKLNLQVSIASCNIMIIPGFSTYFCEIVVRKCWWSIRMKLSI